MDVVRQLWCSALAARGWQMHRRLGVVRWRCRIVRVYGLVAICFGRRAYRVRPQGVVRQQFTWDVAVNVWRLHLKSMLLDSVA